MIKQESKQKYFVILGIVLITALFAFSQLSNATAAKKDGKKFDDWTVACTAKNDETKTPEICMLTQTITITKDDKQQTIALLQIAYFGEKKELKIIQTLPLGVRLEAGTSIISSKKLIAPGRYQTCTQNGCQAVAIISKDDLNTLTSTKENSVALMNLNGQQITLPFSVKGLSKGLKYIK